MPLDFSFSITVGGIAGGLVVLVGAAGLIVWIATHPSDAERIAYWFLSAARLVSKRAEERALTTDVTHRINNFALKLEESVEGYQPIGLKIELVQAGITEEAFLNEGRLIVRMQPRSHRDRNFLTVAVLYVAHTLFPRVKNHLRPNQTEALDLYTTERLIRNERAELVDQFIRDWVNPAVVDNETVERLLGELGRIDSAGTFLPILCQELHLLGARMVGVGHRERLRSELDDFIAFLQALAMRKRGDTTVPLTYRGTHLRVAVQIVSVAARREASGGDPGPWLTFALEHYANGDVDHVYFVGSGDQENRRLIDRVAEEFCSRANWDIYAGTICDATIHDRDGNPVPSQQCIVLCRSRAIRRIA